MDEIDQFRGISLEHVYEDQDMVELAAVVATSLWRGQAPAYAVPDEIIAFAADLQRFVDGELATAEFSAGTDNGIGLIVLQLYRIDRSGHIACHCRLAAKGDPADRLSRLEVEVRTGSWAVLQFARQLVNIVCTHSGKAILKID